MFNCFENLTCYKRGIMNKSAGLRRIGLVSLPHLFVILCWISAVITLNMSDVIPHFYLQSRSSNRTYNVRNTYSYSTGQNKVHSIIFFNTKWSSLEVRISAVKGSIDLIFSSQLRINMNFTQLENHNILVFKQLFIITKSNRKATSIIKLIRWICLSRAWTDY